MKIKAISIWQPWASLIAVGAKKYETRSWHPHYRGLLLICSSIRKTALINLARDYPEVLRVVSRKMMRPSDFPLGMAVAIADLVTTIQTHRITPIGVDDEFTLGDFSPGRYAWKLENVRAIDPFPVKGRQGLFDVELPE